MTRCSSAIAGRLSLPAAVCGLFAAGSIAIAQAPASVTAAFLERMSDEGHGDMSQDYLDRAGASALVSDEFKRTLPLRRLEASFAEARSVADPASRLGALRALAPEVERLSRSSDPAGRLLTDLLDRLATAAADDGRRASVEANRVKGADRSSRLKQARAKLTDARERLAAAEERIVAERETLKSAKQGTDEWRRRSDLGARLGLVRLLRARLLSELAETYPPKSKDYKRLHGDAAKQLAGVYEKYSKWGVGLYAHLYEGRAYRLLGNKQLALAALEDLTAQPAPTEELRKIVTLAHAERAALLVDTGEAAEVLEKPEAWLEGLSPTEADGPEAAALEYQVARGALAHAETLRGAQQSRLRRQARDWLGESARVPSEVQGDARDLWVEVTASLGLADKPPETFEEAFQAGAEAIEAMVAMDVAIESAADAKKEKLREQRAASRDAAYKSLKAATGLVDRKTDPEQAARVRYQLAWLDWEGGETAQAARKAVYVARNDAATASGEEAARLALAALERLVRDGDAAAEGQLSDFVAFVAKQWPGSDVAASGAAVLMTRALRAGDLEGAEAVLESVSDAQRPALALRLAVSRWEKAKDDPAPEGLRRSFDAAGEARGSAIGVTAALYLAEAALNAGDTKRARALLNNADYGPAKRAEASESPADSPRFAVTAFKAKARADALGGRDVSATLDRIAGLINEAPEDQTGGDKAWLGLAVVLLADLDRDPKVAPALAATLDRLGESEALGDWNTRLWVAQARLRVGEALSGSAAEASVRAGADAFAALVARADTEPSFAPSPTAVLAARLRLAQCQQQLRDYEAAIETMVAMLQERAALLEVQQAAAETLQAWGETTETPERLEQAITGDRPGADGKNVVWGWAKIAAVTGRYAGGDAKRREQFFTAWLNVAACRYAIAEMSSGATRDEQLRKAASTIRALERQNPELGGEASKLRFDRLLRKIQAASGESETGLARVGG